jgi:hypothetical protein
VSKRLLRPAAIAQLKQLTGADVSVGSIELEGRGLIRIKDLVIGSKEGNAHGKAIMTARQVEGRFSMWSLLKLKPSFKRITIRGFVINSIYDVDSGLWNLSSIDIAASSVGKGKPPVIVASDGIVKIYRVRGKKIKPVVVVHGEGLLAPVEDEKDSYSFYLGIDHKLAFGGSYFRGKWHSGESGSVSISEGRLLMGRSPIFGNAWNIEDIRCQAEYGADEILLDSLEWRMGEKSRGSISGIITDYRTEGQYDMRIRLDDWRLTDKPLADCLVYGPEAMELIEPGLQEFLRVSKPNGLGGVDLRSKGKFSDLSTSEWTGTIRCDDISVCHEQFPYLLEGIQGTLRLPESTEEHDVVLEDLRCRHGDVELSISGKAVEVECLWDYDLHLVSSNMRLDNDLYEALDDKQKELWRTFSPSGLAGIDYRVSCDPNAVIEGTLELELKGAQAVYEHFPYPLENLTGKVCIGPEKVTLEDVVSRYDGDDRMIRLNGTVTEIDSERPQFNMVIDANNIPIDSTLSAALPPQQREFYERFEVNAITNSRITVFPNEVGRRIVEYIAEVSIEDASMIYSEFPLPLTNVDVDAQLTADKVLLRMMTARSGDGRVDVTGDIWPATERVPKTGFCLSVDAEKLELNDEWLCTLPEEVGQVAARLRPRGRINVAANFNVDAPIADCNELRVVIECLGNSFQLEKFSNPVEGVTGRIEIRQNKADSEEHVVRNATFNMGFYGGRVLGAVEVRRGSPEKMYYELESIFEGVQIADLFTTDPDKDYATSQGRASGSFTAHGIVGDMDSTLGRLSMGITDMKLAKRSLIGKVVAAMQLSEPSDYIFSNMSAEAFVKGNQIVFEEILMSGGSVVLLGKGTLDMETNRVDLKFASYGTVLTSYPSFLETLARGLGSAVIQVDVHGTIEEPQIETKSLPMLQNPLLILGEES